MSSPLPPNDGPPRRQRLSREERRHQLVAAAWQMIGESGADALSLGRLAERAGITKPVVYDHFGTREGLLAALYSDFDERQSVTMDAAMASSEDALEAKASVIADCYVECVLRQGREIPAILAALAGSPEMERIKRDFQLTFIEECRGILTPFAGPRGIATAALWAMLGSAESLSHAAAAGDIADADARAELRAIIVALVARSVA
jgi:AcrR family transcriptional regulator